MILRPKISFGAWIKALSVFNVSPMPLVTAAPNVNGSWLASSSNSAYLFDETGFSRRLSGSNIELPSTTKSSSSPNPGESVDTPSISL